MLVSFSISSGLEFLSVNHTSIYGKSELKVFKNIIFLVKYLIIDQRIFNEQMYIWFLTFVDNHCWQYYNELILLQ